MRVILLHIITAAALLLPAYSSASASTSAMQFARSFALGGVGEAGVMSEGERALRAVLGEPDAAIQLESMFQHATDSGRLYILVGLRMRDRAAYKRALAICSQRESTVETMRGCIVGRESFRSLVSQIDHGNFDVLIKQHPW